MSNSIFNENISISINGPENIVDDVKRCLTIIFSTRKGTQALDRDFGLEWDFLDMPTEAAQAACTAELITAATKYEPRAKVKRVTYTSDASGKLQTNIEVEVKP